MRSWIDKISFGKKKTGADNKKTAPEDSSLNKAGNTLAQDENHCIPINEEDAERVEKMFSRYKGVELMDEFKSIVLELRGKSEK